MTDASSEILLRPLLHFNAENIKFWFLQVKVILRVSRISSETTMFYRLLGALPSYLGAELMDEIDPMPKALPYTILKQSIIERIGSSEKSH